MSPVKSPSSSRRKGKTVASDSPAVPEEETERDLDSECAPLINPWYEINPHFPKVPGEYVPPPQGRVLITLVRRDPDVSWAPLASLVSDLSIRQGVSIPVPLHFAFGSGASSGWKEWVDSELADTVFMGLLQRAGILKAIVSSRCLSNFQDLYNLRHLVRRWCTTTHTFFFSCGELTMTLEDVADQLLLPILSDTDPAALELSPEEEAIEVELRKRMIGNAKLSYWMSSSSKFLLPPAVRLSLLFGFASLFLGPTPTMP